MWKVTINEIEVPECELEFSDKGLLTLCIEPDFQELDNLKCLPSSSDNTFAISAETALVSLSCKACRLISFDLQGQTGPHDTNKGYLRTARLTFAFKRSDKDKPTLDVYEVEL